MKKLFFAFILLVGLTVGFHEWGTKSTAIDTPVSEERITAVSRFDTEKTILALNMSAVFFGGVIIGYVLFISTSKSTDYTDDDE